MKHKFSFDIPKLKFGPSKQETQALKEHLASRNHTFDSEPLTPRSVRPPLPGLVEAELRAACTWVVANYRPSHIPYQAPVGIGVSTQSAQHVDYAAINAQVRREMGGEASQHVQWPSIPSDGVRVEQNGSQWPSSDKFRYKPTETSKDLFHNDEFEAMREQRNSIMEKADQLMSNLEETQKVLLSPEIRTHSRTASNQSTLSLRQTDLQIHQKAAMRPDSVGTLSSTPRTDITGSAWAGSTAPTSAYVTPAHQSKRTSHVQSDTYLPPKVTAVDAEWMRQELEKHLKAQEEELMRQESPVREAAAGLAETTPTQTAQTPASPQSVRRKPVPRRHTGESQQNFSLRADSRQSKPHSRTESRVESMPMSPVSVHITGRPPTSGEGGAKDSQRDSRAKSITQNVRNLVRPSTARTVIRAEAEVERPRSRAQSMRSQVQNFSRPSLDAASRKVSLDISRPQSRGRSVDSFRSAVSAISSTADSSSKQWRNSMARRKSPDSEKSVGARSGRSLESNRGRPRMPRHSPPPPPQPKVNLNRELPPLPGLDQWKPVEVETATAGPTILLAEQPDDEEEARFDSAFSEQRPFPRRQDSLVKRRRAGSARQPPSASSPTYSVFPARHSVYLHAAEFMPAQEQPLAPNNTNDPSTIASPDLTSNRRDHNNRSRSILDAAPPSLAAHMSHLSLSATNPGHPTSIPTAEPRPSRPLSSADAPNFSRKISASCDDDYARMYDARYSHVLEVTPVRSREGKKGKHWWSRGRGKREREREESWMDAVVRSGKTNGVLVTDDVAGPPIVRY